MRTAQLSMVLLLLGAVCQGNQAAQGSSSTLESVEGDESRGPRAGGPGSSGQDADEDRGGPPDVIVETDVDGGVVLDCERGELGEIHVEFDCDSITVYTCKDLSNVVIELEGGERQRVEGLNGHVNTFGVPVGQRIVGVWVKSGANHSGDGPGYGERFDAPEQDCEPPSAGSGGAGGSAGEGGSGGSDACGSNDPDEVCGPPGESGSGGNGGEPLNCDETPDAPGCGVQ